MTGLLKSLALTFSMFSILPAPAVRWDKENIKYSYIFLPLIGLVIGAAELLWFRACGRFQVEAALFASVAALIPVIVSGAIHMDGFIDSCDAVFSYGDKEKKLEILKDPRAGAFGVIGCAAILLLQYGLYSQVKASPRFIGVLALSFAISRILAGIISVTMKNARASGLGHAFSAGSDKGTVMALLAPAGLIVLTAIGWFDPWLALAIFLALSVLTAWFRHFTLKQFGGITGDLAGAFIVLTETLMLAICSIGGVLCSL